MSSRLLVHLAAPVLAICALSVPADAQVRAPLRVTSPAFAQGGSIPSMFSCDGAGQSPPISWAGVPRGTKSIALVADDPDAPHGVFVHWVVYGIAPSTTSLPTDASHVMPPGAFAQGTNGKGDTGFAPIRPPSGTHHYRFRVYALDDVPVALDKANMDELARAMNGHTLAMGELMGTFTRGNR